MATNQTHHDIRFALANTINTILNERAALAVGVARATAIGVPSVGDGGTASTGQLATAVAALDEVVDAAAGDPDFAGIDPVIENISLSSTLAAPLDLSVGAGELIVRVANLLPFPLVRLLAQPGGAATVITPYIKSITFGLESFTGQTDRVCVGTILLGNVGIAVAAGEFKVEVSNPLDPTSAVALSNGIFLTATP